MKETDVTTAHERRETSPRFAVRADALPTEPGRWARYAVTVLDAGVPCGGYERNYGNAEATFEPFEIGGEWFALYSRDYTATRIMRLPSCEDIGGEEPDDMGFCPVEFFVPRYRLHQWDRWADWRVGEKVDPYVDRGIKAFWPGDGGIAAAEAAVAAGILDLPSNERRSFNHALSEWTHCPFGFVAGCVWADDNSWKIQFLDLSRASEGILARKERFGYCELPSRLNLSGAIDMSNWLPDGANDWIGVVHVT